jgi:hypothetical protein
MTRCSGTKSSPASGFKIQLSLFPVNPKPISSISFGTSTQPTSKYSHSIDLTQTAYPPHRSPLALV